ncbi:hypothetical protein Droror1_Dr00015194 [Drosera rotundifolia]
MARLATPSQVLSNKLKYTTQNPTQICQLIKQTHTRVHSSLALQLSCSLQHHIKLTHAYPSPLPPPPPPSSPPQNTNSLTSLARLLVLDSSSLNRIEEEFDYCLDQFLGLFFWE